MSLPGGVGLSPLAVTAVTVVLLILSNLFMTFAWYGHLAWRATPLWTVILVSWGIAFFEYCLHVPANRLGHTVLSGAELKTLHKVITLCVFAGFSVLWLGEPPRWNHAAGLTLIVAGAGLVFYKG
jgi:hypothetical protein